MNVSAPAPRRVVRQSLAHLVITVVSYGVPIALIVYLFLGAGLNFGFLADSTNWDIGSTPLPFDPRDPYAFAFALGLLNTVIAGGVAIVFATLLGFTLSLLRTSGIAVVAGLVRVYSDVIRNIPVILQAMFWYAALLNLPNARNAIEIGGVFVSNRGIYLPWPVDPFAMSFVAVGVVTGIVALVGIGGAASHADPARRRMFWSGALVAALLVTYLGARGIDPDALILWPERRGLNVRDGIRLPVEFSALVLAVVLYRAAYLSEVFRAGFRAVSPGQVEAARSLGLNAWDTLVKIRLPLALLTILPPLSSEFVLIIKITSIGLLVGFSELYSISVASATLTNRSLEAMLLLVTGYLLVNLFIVTVMNLLNRRLARRGNH